MRTLSIFALLLAPTLLIGCAADMEEDDESIGESESDLTRKTYYVSALSPRTIENGFGPIELNRAIGNQAEGDGGKLSIRGKVYSKGLGVHARSDVRVALDGRCSSFRATIGIDDQVNAAPQGKATVAFSVLADGEHLFQSGTVDKTQAGVAINVDITGRKELQLVVDSQGNNEWDAADWASARVLCESKPAPAPVVSPVSTNEILDLFDPSVKGAPPIDSATKLFSPGVSHAALSSLVFGSRYRTCNKVTGCAGWSSTTESWLSVPPKGESGWYDDQSPRGTLIGNASLDVSGARIVASFIGSGSRGGKFSARNCELNRDSGCTLETTMQNCFWAADGTRPCYTVPQKLVYFSSVRLTSDYVLATTDTERSDMDASGTYREAEYAIFALTNSTETPVISASGGSLSVTW